MHVWYNNWLKYPPEDETDSDMLTQPCQKYCLEEVLEPPTLARKRLDRALTDFSKELRSKKATEIRRPQRNPNGYNDPYANGGQSWQNCVIIQKTLLGAI